MEMKRETPGARSEHAGEIKNITGAYDTTNIGFTSALPQIKKHAKGVAPEKAR